MLSSASLPMAVRVSMVARPLCGSRNVLFGDRYPGFSLSSPSYLSSCYEGAVYRYENTVSLSSRGRCLAKEARTVLGSRLKW